MLSGALRTFSEALRSLIGALHLVSGFWGFWKQFYQTVGDEIFFPLYIILGVGKQQDLGLV